MSRIQNADHLVRWLEGGQVAADMTEEMQATLAHLYELTAHHPKAKAKGSVRLEIVFKVEGGLVAIDAAVTSKRPAKPRAGTVAWLLEDGTLSTQHPKQIEMFVAQRSEQQTEGAAS
jgi:hypothetical protein